MNKLLIICALIGSAFGNDDVTTQFVKEFIENEDKSTHLVLNGVCWGKKAETNLAMEVFKSGIRCSRYYKPPKSKHHDHFLLFVADLACPGINDVLLKASSDKLFQFPYRWLVLSSRNVDPANTALWSVPLLSDSDLVLAERVGEEFLLTELYRPSMNHSMQSLIRGYYEEKIVDTRKHRELFRRRRDLMRQPLTMANVIQDNNDTKEHLLKEDRKDLHNDAATKLCWICATHMFEMLNATPRYIFSYRWGYKVNGQWSGMINDIETNKADLGTNCVLYVERLDVVTYTDRVAPLHMRFIFRQPPLAYVSNIFSLPFSSSVWLASAVCVAASTITLYLTSKWENSLERSPAQLDGSIGDALLLTLSAVAQQGCFIEPRRAPGRIMEWVLFTALMALYAAYSANIVVLLQAPSNSIGSLAQLANSKVTLAANDVDYSRFVFSPYKDPTHVDIYRRVIPENGHPAFFDIYEGVERIRQGLFAFHSIVEPVYRLIEETFLEIEKCDLAEVDFVNGFDAFTPVKKDSPYLEMIRVVYKQIRESGILSALIKRFQVPRPRCSDKMSAFSSVGLLDMRSVIALMLYGIGVSLLILVLEMLFFRLSRRSKRNLMP